MSHLEVVREGAFRRDEGLKAAIARLVADNFVDEIGQLEKEFERRDTLYLSRDDSGEVESFFFVSWGSLELHEQAVPTLNTGLTVARRNGKRTGDPLGLYRQAVAEAREREKRHRRKLIVWGTTATPIVYFIARRVFTNLQPAPDGTYSERAGQAAGSIRQALGADEMAGSHPFVFRSLISGVRFLEQERRRVAVVCRRREFHLFDQLGIDEARGDRLLFVAGIPDSIS